MIAALIVLGVTALIASIAFCWAAWDRGNQAALIADLELTIADREAERDQARADYLRAVLHETEWRGVANLRSALHEAAEADATQARLDRDDAHTSLSLVLDELARREQQAVVFAAPTLAQAVAR